MNHNRLQYLLTRYAERDITEKELRELLEQIDVRNFEDIDRVLDKLIAEHLPIDQKPTKFNPDKTLQKIWSRLADEQIKEGYRPIGIKRKRLRVWWAAAVLVGALILFGVWYVQEQTADLQNDIIAVHHDIVLPNDAQVSLRIQDGTAYNLMEMDESALQEKGIKITNDGEGGTLFVVQPSDNETTAHTFTNPKGSMAKLRLADGTTVWLNSGSSITYPSAFQAAERHVEVQGELYFEVARDEKKPFIVAAENMTVRVLGTAFNIAARPQDDGVYTTLIEGSVKVVGGRDAAVLVPGKQAMVSEQGNVRVADAKLRDVLAWKNGYFSFNDYNIDQVMEELSRWYDIEDLHIEARTDDLFVASVARTRSLSELLEHLEKISNYKFKIEGRRVMVMV